MALNGNLPLLSSSKNHSHCACHAHQRPPTPSAWNHQHTRVSDFVPIASLLEWQWRQIVMRNGQFYHSSRNGASQTAQYREIPHSLPEPFYLALQVRVGDPTTHPPSPPAVSARNWTKYNKSLKDPVRGAGSAQVQIRSYRNRQSCQVVMMHMSEMSFKNA